MPKHCERKGCPKTASFGYVERKPLRCGADKLEGMTNVVSKKCGQDGCTVFPSFNFPGIKGGIKCERHSLPGMIGVQNKSCEDCHQFPSFNFPGLKEGRKCGDHKEPGMTNVKNKKCEECGIKHPCFAFRGERPRRCEDCKLDGMIDTNHKLCERCDRRAKFSHVSDKGPRVCKDHFEDGMINANGTSCQMCNKTRKYAFPGDKPFLCGEHSLDGMIDVVSKRCETNGCPNICYYNFPGQKKRYCGECKSEGMINVTSKRCEDPECMTIPSFNYPGKRPGRFCVEHAPDDMVNIYKVCCSKENCDITAIWGYPGGKVERCARDALDGMIDLMTKKCKCGTTVNYNIFGQSAAFCVRCKPPGAIFRPTPRCKAATCIELATHGVKKPERCKFHHEDGQKSLFKRKCLDCGHNLILLNDGKCKWCSTQRIPSQVHAKELLVKDYFNAHNLKYLQHDRVVNRGSHSKDRPDFLFGTSTHYVVSEVDEYQHKYISSTRQDEEDRMKRIFTALGRKTVFIRYNPDNYRAPTQKKPQRNEPVNNRLEVLGRVLNKYLETEPTNDLSVCYLFYDDYDGKEHLTTILDNE